MKHFKKFVFVKKFILGIYNPKTNTILGQKPLNLAILCTLYLLYIALLLILFILLLHLARFFFYSMSMPNYDPDIMESPGLVIYPLTSLTSPLIWLKTREKSHYMEKIETFLKKYDNKNFSGNEFWDYYTNKKLGPCAQRPHGYENKKEPFCIYLMLNKIFHWIPHCYNDTLSLPITIPIELKSYIQNLYSKSLYMKMNYIWLSCSGDQPIDRDKIGYFEFYPRPGFDANYFPYKKKTDEEPMVAIRFYDIQPGVLVTIKCVAYAMNSPQIRSRTFQIYLESER